MSACAAIYSWMTGDYCLAHLQPVHVALLRCKSPQLTDTVEKVDLSTDDMVIGQNLVPVSLQLDNRCCTRAVIEESFPHSSRRCQPREPFSDSIDPECHRVTAELAALGFVRISPNSASVTD